ncbi:SDR family NAD(P)-dependent oxidoreductase [Nonomuraea zeae]|uniref:SDR family oxidoreductase n=1 Tax=Nonomuraea zeae TaxID=1642303 RepID=A0A5S4FGZ9_9ACTN|nr:SDR family oxidoreductase [Nonomuraea zeae]TMR17998.1 SDR family oxidoreductase [Nonomuraea zeae]
MTDLAGKTALVTGASRGIGRAIAVRLAADGARVIVHYARNDELAEETVAEIERGGGRAYAVRAAFEDGVDELFAGIGDERLDIVVNNAAILGGVLGTVSEEQFDRVFAVNVRAPYFVIERALPLMNDGGRIINISSAVVRIALPDLVYSMTKGALDTLGFSLAPILGPRNITVNTVSPGVTETDMNAWLREDHDGSAERGVTEVTALGRIGRPDDIAAVVALLTRADSHWITGQVLDASGGYFLGPRGGVVPV